MSNQRHSIVELSESRITRITRILRGFWWCDFFTIVWKVSVGFMTGSQSIADFSECFLHKSNLHKNKLDCPNGQSRRDEIASQ